MQHAVRAADRAAFTLVELMVVVIIAIILMAVTLPSVKYSIEEGKLREGARQFNAYFAVAKARATTTGRPAGVWLELGQIGDPNATVGNRMYECSQVYLAEIPAPYSGDYQNARAVVRNGLGDDSALNATANRWLVDFPNQASVGSLIPVTGALIEPGDTFSIRFDGKSHVFKGIRDTNDNQYYIFNGGIIPPRSNGVPTTNPNAGYSFQIFRSPIRIGQPLELPRGIVIDVSYSGLGTSPVVTPPSKQILVMFSPGGGVGSVTVYDQSGNIAPGFPDTGTSKVHFLVGKTEQVEFPWNNRLPQSNIADGSNLWVTINRRNGSVATVENTPDLNQPYGTLAEKTEFLRRAREFAITGEVKGGQ